MKKLIPTILASLVLVSTAHAGIYFETIHTPNGDIQVDIIDLGVLIEATYHYPDGSIVHAHGIRAGITIDWTYDE